MQVRVSYSAPPTLSAFLDSDAFVRCVIGPVGSGKSSGCVLELLRRAREQEPSPDGIRRSRFAVIRNTYGQLRDTTRKTFEAWIPPQLGTWNEQQLTFRMRFADVDCEVLFRALDRPEDVKKLLSLDLTGAYINEAREIGRHVFEVLQTRVGRYPSRIQGGPTWFGIWMDTNPWHTGHWAHKLFKAKPEGHELFRQPGGRSEHAENVENLPPGYYTRLCIGKDTDWVRVYVDGEEASSDIGAIWGDLIDKLEHRGGILGFAHDTHEVFTSWDLGFSDSTAIWFWRLNGHGMPDIIDFYQSHGMPLSHYFDLVDSKGYQYAKHWLPHDARAKTLATGTSVVEQFASRYGAGAVAIGPSLSLMDGIQSARWMLEQPMRIHSRCAEGVESLMEYRYEWDEAGRCFSRRPLHNFASHPADAFRYVACVIRKSELLTRKEQPEPKPIRNNRDWKLDELWSTAPSGGSGRV